MVATIPGNHHVIDTGKRSGVQRRLHVSRRASGEAARDEEL